MDMIETLLQQVEKAREHGDRPLEAESLSTLGDFYYDDQKWDEARQAYEDSLEVFRELENDARIAGTQVRIADVYMAQKEWQQAIELCENARDTMEQVGDDSGLARTYTNLGVLYWQIGEWKQAVECYQTRLEIVERLGDPKEIAKVSANLGMLCQVFGNLDVAAHYMAQGYLIAVREGFETLIDQTSAQLASILGNAEAANAYIWQIAGEDTSPLAIGSEEQSEALARLLATVTEALEGDNEMVLQLSQYTKDLAGDEEQPAETRELGRILNRILCGERSPDLSALPTEVACPVRDWLNKLTKES